MALPENPNFGVRLSDAYDSLSATSLYVDELETILK